MPNHIDITHKIIDIYFTGGISNLVKKYLGFIKEVSFSEHLLYQERVFNLIKVNNEIRNDELHKDIDKNYDVNKTHFIPNIIYREYGINSNRGGNFRVMTCRNHFKQPDKNYLLYFTEWLMIVNSYRKAGIQLPVGLLSCTKLLISYDKYNNKLYSKCSWCEKNRPIKKYVYKHVYITMCKKCYLSPKKRTPMKQM